MDDADTDGVAGFVRPVAPHRRGDDRKSGFLPGVDLAFFLLCKHRAQYPTLFIILSVGRLGFVILDLTVANVTFKVAVDPGDVRDLVRGIVSSAIWFLHVAVATGSEHVCELTYRHPIAVSRHVSSSIAYDEASAPIPPARW
jgi:hypothetical protein